MRVTFKLFATLSDYLPQEGSSGVVGAQGRNVVELEVPDGTPIQSIIERYQLPPKLVHLVLVNGAFVAPEKRPATALQPGDTLAIWPPIAGG